MNESPEPSTEPGQLQIFKMLQYARVPLISIADGIDTSTKHAKLTYTIKSLVADLYLDDLRDKTLRGMEGRALAGYATGQVPYGYRTRSETDGRGRELGRRIEIDGNTARILVRIFTEWVEGRSMSWIARSLNREGIASPRIGTRHRFAGWSVGTIRVMLRNERYIGVWRFKTMQWVKVPGTNRRLPRKRPASEAIVRDRPELRIVDLPLWEAAQVRNAERPSLSFTRVKTRYLLSGLVVCSGCEAPMTICGNSTTTYYRCVNRTKKGTCTNSRTVRSVGLLAEVFDLMRSSLRGNAVLRSAIESHNSHQAAVLQPQIDKLQTELAGTEEQLGRLVDFVAAGGQRLDYVAEKMRRLEITARTQKSQLEVLDRVAKSPLRKVAPREVGLEISRLRQTKKDEIEGVRERLRRWTGNVPIRFDGTSITLELSPAAIVADIARNGFPAPTKTTGETIIVRHSVEHLLAGNPPPALVRSAA